jgi:phospholipid transport system transporter-binding protein
MAQKPVPSAAESTARTRVQGECNRFCLEGPVTFATVGALLEEGNLRIRAGASVIDFTAVTAVDSAAVALAIAWLRVARASGRNLEFVNPPPAMIDLARLYAVADLLPLGASPVG